jgi:GH25 family lysozyme M1 (1,4-beta-N-acetylmuramidase)
VDEIKVIDVSKHNGIINFDMVKKDGYNHALIRAGYGRLESQKDPTFENNYRNAKAAGLKVGAYWYSYAVTADEAKLEAEVFLKIIKGKQFELPVYLDIEEDKQVKLGKNVCSAMINSFCQTMEKAGYFVGIYTYDNFYKTNIDDETAKRYTCWVARLGSRPTFCKKYDAWQYSWKGKVKGINTDVDLSYMYKDFEPIIKKAKLNGFGEKVKTYNLTATISDIIEEKADVIKKICEQQGMKVTITEK